jgi:glutaredoxin 3
MARRADPRPGTAERAGGWTASLSSPCVAVVPHIRVFTSDACGYCVRAKRLLAHKGVDFEEIHFPRHDMEARMRLVELTGRYTVPQIIIDGQPVGGYDDIKALDDAGRLDPLLGLA